MRLIDADALVERIIVSGDDHTIDGVGCVHTNSVIMMINRMPTISPEHIDEAEYDAHVAEMVGVAEAIEMEGCQ